MRSALAIAGFALLASSFVAAAPSWSMKVQNFASIALAIDCDSPTNCMSPTVNTNNGTDVLFSTDQGANWSQYGDSLEMMLLGGAIAGKTAAASGPFNVIASYDNNLYNWTNVPKGQIFIQSQNVEPFGTSCFGAAGLTESNNPSQGTTVSCDSGRSWTFANCTNVAISWARYGAYPSAKTWYLSLGNWPENTAARHARMQPDSKVRAISSRIHLNLEQQRAEFQYASQRTAQEQWDIAASGTSYLAQLVKTTDGGKTWTSQFESSGLFYFNQIGCPSVNHCCAVGEADTDSKTPGVQVWCTFDGTNWSQTYKNNDPTLSALSLQFLNENHVFVGGASLRQQLIEGIFFESLDGGKTWAESFVKDAYPNELTFGSQTWGLSTCFDLEGASCLLEYA